jgi:outer membrane biogenesis lipoprotein LolB
MLKNTFFILLAASFLLTSCDYKEKEKNLTDREKQLLEKEKTFAKKESEYQSLLKMRDSIFAKKIRWLLLHGLQKFPVHGTEK